MPVQVLCVDDSVTMQRVAAITFAQPDFAVTAAMSAEEGVALVRQVHPDLILADSILLTPGQSRTGYDLCLSFKTNPATRSIPVIILAGNSQSFDEARGRAVGADGHLVKPWDTQVAVDKVTEVLARVGASGVAQPGRSAGSGANSLPTSATGTAGATAPARPLPPQPPGARQSGIHPSPAAAVAVAAAVAAAVPPTAAPPQRPGGPPRPSMIRAAQTAPAVTTPARTTSTSPSVTTGARVPTVPLRPPSGRPKPGSPFETTTPVMGVPIATPPRQPTLMGIPATSLPAGGPAVQLRSGPSTQVHVGSTAPAQGAPSRPSWLPSSGPPAPLRQAPIVESAVRAQVRPPQPVVAAELRGPEVEALTKLSREIIERIVWEVVPELAETIIKQHLDRLAADRR